MKYKRITTKCPVVHLKAENKHSNYISSEINQHQKPKCEANVTMLLITELYSSNPDRRDLNPRWKRPQSKTEETSIPDGS